MKPLFVISCPFDTYSGYGARSRDLVKAINKENEYLQINQILAKEFCSKLVIDSKRKSIKKLLKLHVK